MSVLNKNRRGITLIELMIVIVIIGIIFAYVFVSAGRHTERARHSRAMEDIAVAITALSISYTEQAGDWVPKAGTSTTGKADPFAGLFDGDGGHASEIIDRKLSKSISNMKDPWGQPYDLVMTTDAGRSVLHILCRPGTSAVTDPGSARENEYSGDRLARSVTLKSE